MKCKTCKYRFSNICEWHSRFIRNYEKACLDYETKPPQPSPDAIWCGSQLGWKEKGK